MNQVQELDVGQTVHCLEVLHAVQTDSRTSVSYTHLTLPTIYSV